MDEINIDGQVLEKVKQFKYLISLLTEDGCNEKEVRKDAFNKHQTLLTGKTNRRRKKRLIKTLVWSVLLNGSKTWTMKKDDIKILESCEMWIWRRMKRSAGENM
ncbi:hypothetical protein CAPTEDRAFT_206364 [Capitella teleta]|uniref:Uncharacterized protein n=1 Tax=Capitella teleta TaxID=283909 RepID=R7UBE2_CAPTE|nr:hypothetical protein CAPTEDRAFT_206364 [Capitella teleta]|eukprot:ELU03690.1 hypothetical protein CAPTEDRAFT_206364 [Capitella teleta]